MQLSKTEQYVFFRHFGKKNTIHNKWQQTHILLLCILIFYYWDACPGPIPAISTANRESEDMKEEEDIMASPKQWVGLESIAPAQKPRRKK